MFRFADPYAFFLLIPAAMAAWRVYRRRVRAGILFAPALRLSGGQNTWRTRASRILPALFLAGVVLAIAALARPQTVLSKVRRSVDVIAIMMAVDISGSMEALDLSTDTNSRTRLDAVKETFAEFIEQRPDDLAGLVTFGGYASTRAPLTTDHNALLHILGGVEIPRPRQGNDGATINQEELLTAIGDGLATALARLKDVDVKSRIVVLLSDGESNTGIIKPEEAARAAKELGIKVYTIGVGTQGRAPFRTKNIFGQDAIQYAYVTLDEKLLRRIADTTGGRYFNVRNPKGLEEAMAEIDELEKTEVEREEYFQYRELFPWLLAASLAMVLLGTGLNMILAGRVA